MVQSGFWEIAVLCPFYCRTEKSKHRIVCEGIMKDSRLALVFLGQDSVRVQHMKKHCCKDYQSCPLYRAIAAQYE